MLCTHCIISACDCVYKYSVLYLIFSFSIQCGYIWGFLNGEGNGTRLQYSYVENSMDRGAWRAVVCGVTKESDTTEHAHM